MKSPAHWVLAAMCACVWCGEVFGQAECTGWGGLRGIRVDGELMAFTTGIRAVSPGLPVVQVRGERLTNPQFSRDSDKQICSGGLSIGEFRAGGGFGPRPPSRLNCTLEFKDTGPGIVTADIQVRANADVKLAGIYFFIHLPSSDYSNGLAQLVDTGLTASLAATRPAERNHYFSGSGKDLQVKSPHRQLEIVFDTARDIVIEDDRRRSDASLDIYFPLSTGNLAMGQTLHTVITFKVSGDIDKTPANLAIDPYKPGGVFDGIGGNFRLQSEADPAQIQYNLENLRVAWGRVAMPLNMWQPMETGDPIQEADAGKIDIGVRQAMEMAHLLARKNIPMIISVWFAPAWALAPGGNGPRFFRARRINSQKWDQVCQSIGSYLQYLKQKYDTEPRLFSFNESNIGIDVLQSPKEHADAIKRLGAYFSSHGLATKMLLGDTGDAPPIDFINAAMADPDAIKYIGAVSFHSWHGGSDELFARWGHAAKKLGVPLLVAEGGTDSDSYAYPNIFLEPWYGLDEISEYMQICRTAQPLSILQWQLTENYSLLTGGQNGEPFQPTQRFWQLKQLDATPVNSAAIPITCDKSAVVACAYEKQNAYMVHLVNNGATRPATISGFPDGVKELRVYVTDRSRSMKELPPISVTGGVARISLDTQSYTTLFNAP